MSGSSIPPTAALAARPRPRPRAAALLGALVALASALPSPSCGPNTGSSAGEAQPGERARSDRARVERVVAAMGTQLTVRADALDRATALAASEAAVASVAATEARLSNWDPSSEIERLAREPEGTPSPALAADLAAFEPWVARTDGAFDPRASGAGRRDAVGSTRSARSVGALDTGGWGKGRALDLAARAALDAGATRVELSFGGQVLVRAVDGEALDHRVPLADPDARERAVVTVALPFAGAATSSQSLRPGHIVDPRGDALDANALAARRGSVTVFCDDATAADALSTGLFVLGRERALAYAHADDGCEVLVLERADDGLHAHLSAGLADRVRTHADDVRLHLHATDPDGRDASPPDRSDPR